MAERQTEKTAKPTPRRRLPTGESLRGLSADQLRVLATRTSKRLAGVLARHPTDALREAVCALLAGLNDGGGLASALGEGFAHHYTLIERTAGVAVANAFQEVTNLEYRSLLSDRGKSGIDWWAELGDVNELTDGSNYDTVHKSNSPTQVPTESSPDNIEPLLVLAAIERRISPDRVPGIAKQLTAEVRARLDEAFATQGSSETPDAPERVLADLAARGEHVRRKQTALAEMARSQLKSLLADLTGREFEAPELPEAKRIASLLNNLARVGECELRFEGQAVTVSVVRSTANPRPTFHLRTSPPQKTLYGSKKFPSLSFTICN